MIYLILFMLVAWAIYYSWYVLRRASGESYRKEYFEQFEDVKFECVEHGKPLKVFNSLQDVVDYLEVQSRVIH